MEKVFKEAIKRNGIPKQLVVVIEELAELIYELSTPTTGENLIEELADVEIVLDELYYIFNLEKEEVTITYIGSDRLETTTHLISALVDIQKYVCKTYRGIGKGEELKHLMFKARWYIEAFKKLHAISDILIQTQRDFKAKRLRGTME